MTFQKKLNPTIGAIFAICTSCLLMVSYTPAEREECNEDALARVQSFQGKEIYVMSEPVKEYVTVDKVGSTTSKWLAQQSIDKDIHEMISKSVNREMKGKIEKFDAIITSTGHDAILIRFTE